MNFLVYDPPWASLKRNEFIGDFPLLGWVGFPPWERQADVPDEDMPWEFTSEELAEWVTVSLWAKREWKGPLEKISVERAIEIVIENGWKIKEVI